MSSWARVENDTAIEVISTDPEITFHPELAALFLPVPDGTLAGATFDGTDWMNPPPPTLPEPVTAPGRLQVSRPEFKQLLTSAERIAIRTARAYGGDNAQALAIKAGLDDLFDILEDPALTYVDLSLPTTQEGVTLLAQVGLIAPERVAEILRGWSD